VFQREDEDEVREDGEVVVLDEGDVEWVSVELDDEADEYWLLVSRVLLMELNFLTVAVMVRPADLALSGSKCLENKSS
jgi:hypothetical protein